MIEVLAGDQLGCARRLAEVASEAADGAAAAAARLMDRGDLIDQHQKHAQRIAQLATRARAAAELVAYAERRVDAGGRDNLAEAQACAFTAEVVLGLRCTIDSDPNSLGLDASLLDHLDSPELRSLMQAGLRDSHVRSIGVQVLNSHGAHRTELDDDDATMIRNEARKFAQKEIAPLARELHEKNELISEDLIGKMAKQGYYGSSIPKSYGGAEIGYLPMVVLTEELSAVSLAVGSVTTRSEIFTRALLKGGTEEQRQRWLPSVASGEVMVSIGVTEPNVGSDVASIETGATRGELDGVKGWFLKGTKQWSTFSGRANVMFDLCRTGSPGSGAKGLSLFIIEKDPYRDRKGDRSYTHKHDQPGGGSINGTEIPTLGYRGMHSFTVSIDDYFVPATNVLGGEDGLNRGFRYQMAGFEAGRLQTGGRATGVGQASLELACAFALERRQFGRPIAEYQLMQHKIGRMATHVAAGRHLTYAAARAMAADERAAVEPAMCKLFASDVAVWVSQEAQLIHGGMGYAVETPVARYVVDALVLPIFEGVKPILEMKVIARQLLRNQGVGLPGFLKTAGAIVKSSILSPTSTTTINKRTGKILKRD